MNVAYLSGGVGGAKLALGLSKVLDSGELAIIANTGDDFEHLGFPVCPDIDTLVYTLAGLANTEQGWGRQDETGHFMETMKQLGGPDWFFLGDRDLAMHAARKALMAEGRTLTEVTAQLSEALGISQRILPMCNEPAPTTILTEDGPLAFQDYFVRLRAAPAVTSLQLCGDGAASATAEVFDAIARADLIVIGPSNPLISIDPILTVSGVREAIKGANVPVVAVSPIVGGKAIKGPTAKMMEELGKAVSVLGIAGHYRDIATHLVIDPADKPHAAEARKLTPNIHVTGTVMRTLEDKTELARKVVALARQ